MCSVARSGKVSKYNDLCPGPGFVAFILLARVRRRFTMFDVTMRSLAMALGTGNGDGAGRERVRLFVDAEVRECRGANVLKFSEDECRFC